MMGEVLQKDKMAVLQVLGSLLKKPSLFLEDDFKLTIDDFPEKFHQIIFGAIDNLIKNGVQAFTFITIDDFLGKYERQYKVFTLNNGNDYIQKAMIIAEPDNFSFYYNNLKKFSLLNRLERCGFDSKRVFNPEEVNPETAMKIQKSFDLMTIEDIISLYEKDIVLIKDDYWADKDSKGVQASHGLKELKESLKETPEMGMPLFSKKLTTIFRGARLKKLYIRSGFTGSGKSRFAVADAVSISVPIIWDDFTETWISTGCCEPTLYITTELSIDEIQTMILACISCVPEDKILDGKYTPEEEARVDRAIEIVEKSPLFIEHVPNFNIDDIERTIKKYKFTREIGYVFFDYIFTSIKILMEVSTKTKGIKLREDNILLLFADRMKSIADTLNVHISTSTQVSDNYKSVKDADQSVIRGSKAISDKADIGYVAMPVTPKDMEMITPIIHGSGFNKTPNYVYHIYKVRRGKLNKVKLWYYADLGTCRTYDLFVTDNDYKLLNVTDTNISTILDETTIDREEEFVDLDEDNSPVSLEDIVDDVVEPVEGGDTNEWY